MNNPQLSPKNKKGPPLTDEVIILTPEPGNSGQHISVSGTSSCASGNTVTLVVIDNNGQHPNVTYQVNVIGDYWSTTIPLLASGNVTILAYCTGANPVTGSSVSNLHYQEEGASFDTMLRKIGNPILVKLGDFDPNNDCIFVMEKTVDPTNKRQSKKDAMLIKIKPGDITTDANTMKSEYTYSYTNGDKNLVRIIFSNGRGKKLHIITFFTYYTGHKK